MESHTLNLSTIHSGLDAYLNIGEIRDYPNALNGLQLENDGRVTRLGAAVDASLATIELAIAQQVDLLLVHHGLFWGGVTPVVGRHFQKLKRAISGNLAIYSAHLPLDIHPEIGNNMLLAQTLQLPDPEPFFFQMGRNLGIASKVAMERDQLVARLESGLGGKIWICAAGPQKTRRIGIITGGAGSKLEKAADEGIDTFITGEGPHYTFALAEELRVNLIYAGHYATETFGVCALAEMFSVKYDLPWCFLDHPSRL